MATIDVYIIQFLENLAKIDPSRERLSAAKLYEFKHGIEIALKRVTKASDVELVISIDDLDEFDEEIAA